MAGKVRENLEIPRAGTVDRDTFVRDIARILLEGTGEVDKDLTPRAEQFLGGVRNYLLGRIHDRPDQPAVQAVWRGKAPLVSLMHGLLSRQRETMGDSAEALRKWLEGLVVECETGKYNPLAARAFSSLAKAQPRQAALILDLVERALLREMGFPA